MKINEEKYDVEVSFSLTPQRFEITVPILQQGGAVTDFLFGRRFEEITVVDIRGEEFTAYGCMCLRRETSMEKVTVLGRYKTLIHGRKIPRCGMLSFHFDGMEYFFRKSLEKITGQRAGNENQWDIMRVGNKIVASVLMFEATNMKSLLSEVLKVREYFEFIVDKEILVDQVVYSDRDGTCVEILNDELLFSKSTVVFDRTSKRSLEKIVEGLNQWLMKYNMYEEVISIWRKTIYNSYVSEEDTFIWRCQALELLCTLYEPLLIESKRCMANKKREAPNLREFMVALNNIHRFIECEETYFKEVKDVRNVYTHYNPKKHITEREWWNASHLIVVALNEALQYVFNLDVKAKEFFFLIPPGTQEDIRR